jgi:hypothetical protein
MTELGPVSSVLEGELRTKVRRHSLVIWLDPDSQYSGFVDQLLVLRAENHLPYPVHSYRGSFLELLLDLEPLVNGVDKPPLLIHLPGFNEETVKATPLLELYEAGTCLVRNLNALVIDAAAGKVRPEQITAFQDSGRSTLSNADTWLTAMLSVQDGALGGQLRAVSLISLVDDLLGDGPIAVQFSQPGNQLAVWQCLATLTGLSPEMGLQLASHGSMTAKVNARDVAFAAASWALRVEYVHDLKRAPVAAQLQGAIKLPETLIQNCRDLAGALRDNRPLFYRETADETENELVDERAAVRAEDLGLIDTFRFEEERVLLAAIEALENLRWAAAATWATQRTDNKSFWLRDDAPRRNAWQLIGDAAQLGLAIEKATLSLGKVQSLEEAVQRYVECGAAVDQAHRHLEQRRLTLFYTQLPEFVPLRERLDVLRDLWREWADAWAREFNVLCQRQGFLPPASLQQRTLFEDVVKPLIHDSETTALFVVDALRFEMAKELHDALADPSMTNMLLTARLAELPTVTAIGMNALAPVAERGRMKLVLQNGAVGGFDMNQFRVFDPETRKRAMHDRVGGSTCPWLKLDEVLNRDAKTLKQTIGRARLVVVHSQEIDEAGESGAGLAVFDLTLQQLRAAWRKLREAGVKRFVITADHGFLLNDETTRKVQPHGRKSDPDRRHVFSPVAADHANQVRVSLRDLGYDCDSPDQYLMFPETTALFDRGNKPSPFVHGGNSLQERVIPVLTLVHRTSKGGSPTQYLVSATARQGVAGMHCLQATVTMVAQKTLGFSGSPEVELGLRVSDVIDVQVELCEARGAVLSAGTITATVGQAFELFFRLAGTTDARALVELYHLGSDAIVTPCVVNDRFGVTATGRKLAVEAPTVAAPSPRDWLQKFTDAGVRQFFEHLALHGTVTESEACTMLEGQRALRRFAGQFETYAKNAPFTVRIDVVAGVKRYVRA